MIVDTSVLLAHFDETDPWHLKATELIDAFAGPMVVSPYVVQELDYLVMARVGVAAELAVLKDLASNAWSLPGFGADDLNVAVEVVARYRDLRVGVADASNVVLAHRYGTDIIATLDRRHFTVLRSLSGGYFTLVP